MLVKFDEKCVEKIVAIPEKNNLSKCAKTSLKNDKMQTQGCRARTVCGGWCCDDKKLSIQDVREVSGACQTNKITLRQVSLSFRQGLASKAFDIRDVSELCLACQSELADNLARD